MRHASHYKPAAVMCDKVNNFKTLCSLLRNKE